MISKVMMLSCLLAMVAPINYIIENKLTTQTQELYMIQLYIYQYCPYCTKVITFLQENNLLDQVELVDAQIEANRNKLLEISGRTQAPFLVDSSTDTSMPESDDIIEYFKKTYLS